MATHRYHPNVEAGDPDVSYDAPILFDDCERCDQHASHPSASLDRLHLLRLGDVIHGRVEPVTENERRAARQYEIEAGVSS